MPSKFFLYRVEAAVLLSLFVGAFAATIYSGSVGWFIIIWVVTGIGAVHLNRLRCPTCGERVMRRRTKYFYVGRLFFLKKCSKCGFDLTQL